MINLSKYFLLLVALYTIFTCANKSSHLELYFSNLEDNINIELIQKFKALPIDSIVPIWGYDPLRDSIDLQAWKIYKKSPYKTEIDSEIKLLNDSLQIASLANLLVLFHMHLNNDDFEMIKLKKYYSSANEVFQRHLRMERDNEGRKIREYVDKNYQVCSVGDNILFSLNLEYDNDGIKIMSYREIDTISLDSVILEGILLDKESKYGILEIQLTEVSDTSAVIGWLSPPRKCRIGDDFSLNLGGYGLRNINVK